MRNPVVRAVIAGGLALLVLLSVAIIATSGGNDDPVLPGSGWIVTEIPGVAIVPDATPTLEFTETDVNGSGGCNTLNGTYTASDGNISVSPLATTLIGCEDAIAAQEGAFSARLQGASSYTIDGDTLTLDGPQGSIVLARA